MILTAGPPDWVKIPGFIAIFRIAVRIAGSSPVN